MKDLWSRTTELFWEYPILWLPLICADLSAFCLTALRELATKQIRTWIFTTHSVLGDKVALPVSQASLFIKAAACTFPLVWGNYILNACLYTASFVITASLVRMVLHEEKPRLPNAIRPLWANLPPILLFSVKFLVLYVLAAIPVIIPFAYLTVAVFHHASLPQVISEAATLPASILVAWLLVPAGIKLLQPKNSQGVSVEAKKSGRIFAMAVAVSSVVIGCLALQARQEIVNTAGIVNRTQAQILDASISLLIAFPYVLLYIALAVLAVENVSATSLRETCELDQSVN